MGQKTQVLPEERFTVKPLVAAKREAADVVKGVPNQARAYAFLVEQARYLRFWPTLESGDPAESFALSVKRIEECYELRVADTAMLGPVQVRIFFWPEPGSRTIWILSVRKKKSRKTPDAVKEVCRQRLRALRNRI